MPDEKTPGNRNKTVSNQEIAARLDLLTDALLDLHNDLRKVVKFVDDNEPALTQAKALMNPGGGMRRMLRMRGPAPQEGTL